MSLIDGKLDYAEANVDALETYVTKHQSAKTAQIGYLVNQSAMKVGVGNLNKYTSWEDNSKLDYITMSTRYLGVQMDAEHDLDENEVTEMTQMISAISSHGYTSEIANQVYSDIGNVIVEALSDYDAAIINDDPQEIYKLLGEAFVKSFENNDRDTLGLAQAFVLKASKALKEGNYEFRIPFSAETVNGIFISTISSLFTKKGIRRKYEGFAGVLTPSHNMMQYYTIGGINMMYEQFTDKVREKGIQALINPADGSIIKTAAQRAVEDVFIDQKLNPFIEPSSVYDIDFEDTAVVFNASDIDKDGNVFPTAQYEAYYIQDFNSYDIFKNQDLTGKVVYKFTSRPKNLKGTNTKFKVDGNQWSIYDLPTMRAAYYFEEGRNKDYIQAVLAQYGYTNMSGLNVRKVFQKIIQSNLRSLKKGLPINGIKLENGIYVPTQIVATDVQVTPAQIVTGRYNAKAFLMDSSDKFSDVMEQKADFFYNKLRNRYGITEDEPKWTERILFSTSGERYLVRTVTDKSKIDLELEGYKKDNSIQKFGNTYYHGETKIGTFENVDFYQYQDENGKIWKVILTNPETKNKLNQSEFFEMWRDNFTDENLMTEEHAKFIERLRIRAQRMYESFDRMRYLLGTRIPTQDMQSFMPEEIIGWTDSTVNDLYVPVQMFVVKGNDLDIDKEYELCYGVNKQGILHVNTKLVNVPKFSFEELFKLLPPNGIEYTTSKEVDDKTFVVSHNDLLNEIDLINRIIKSGTTKIHFDYYDSEAANFVNHLNMHTTTQLSEEVVDKSIKNQVVNNILKVSTDPENQVISQISVDTVTKPLKNAASKSELALYEKTINSDNPMVIYTMQVQNMVGREVIGITAVALKQFFAKTAFYNQKINDFANKLAYNPFDVQNLTNELLSYVLKKNPLRHKSTVFANLNFLDVIENLGTIYPATLLTDGRVIPWAEINVKIDNTQFNNLYDLLVWMQNEADKNDSSLTQSGILSEATDNAKSLTLSKINATQSFVDIYTYMSSLGENVEYVADIMISPAFTYITKLVDGDMFDGESLSVKNAINFYLGDYIFAGIDPNSLTTITSGLNPEDKNYYKKVLEVCQKIKNTSYSNDNIEFAQNEYLTALEENSRAPKPAPLVKNEIDQIIKYFKECEIRDNFIAANGGIDDSAILILNEILPGVEEQGILGALCGLNQGLRTKTFDKIKFIQRIENYVNKQIQAALKQSKKETDKHAEIRLKVIEILGEETTFDLFNFASNDVYQKKMIDAMSYMKHTDNVLEIITTIPHFKQMLHTWAVDETFLRKASVKYNLEKYLMKEIKPNDNYSFNESEFTEIKKYVNDMMILNWFFDSDLKINIPIDQKIYNITGNDDYSLDGVLRLNDIHALASFKRLVENYIVPNLKQTEIGRNNAFLNALTITSDNTNSGIKSYLQLPIPMMDVEKSIELETAYNSYIRGFDEIATMDFGGMNVGDIFYLYNLIVNKDSFGQKSLTRLFENLVNSNRGSFLVNSYNQWIADLDKTGDYSKLKLNLEDLTGRIAKYALNTDIRGGLQTEFNSDYTFEVPNFAKTWKPLRKINMIFGRETLEDRDRYINEGYPAWEATYFTYGEAYEYFGDIEIITKDDWDYIDDSELGLDIFSPEEREYLKKQKAFIHNGKIYINAENGDYTDALHEWTHYILATMKWSNDPEKRNNYYKILSKVSNHPKFNDIARHYPWAHGSDLQEEVLVNLMQMWMQNKVFANDNVIEDFMQNDNYDGIGTVFEMILKDDYDNTDLKLGEALEILRTEDFEEDRRIYLDNFQGANNISLLKKHQKIMQLKDKLIEEEYLKMICK